MRIEGGARTPSKDDGERVERSGVARRIRRVQSGISTVAVTTAGDLSVSNDERVAAEADAICRPGREGHLTLDRNARLQVVRDASNTDRMASTPFSTPPRFEMNTDSSV